MAGPKNVIERLEEQLKLAGCVRGARKPIYVKAGTRKILSHYAQRHISVVCTDVIELCALARDQADEIVQAQMKGHQFGASTAENRAVMYADDLWHLIDLAKPSPKPVILTK